MRRVPAEAVRREQHSGLLLAWLPAGRAQSLTTYQAEAGQLVAATTGTDRVGCTGRGTTGPT